MKGMMWLVVELLFDKLKSHVLLLNSRKNKPRRHGEHRETQRNIMIITQKYINEISSKIIGCAIEVHKYPGP
jgi:hypothetical protein